MLRLSIQVLQKRRRRSTIFTIIFVAVVVVVVVLEGLLFSPRFDMYSYFNSAVYRQRFSEWLED
jgi:hypothetical protein